MENDDLVRPESDINTPPNRPQSDSENVVDAPLTKMSPGLDPKTGKFAKGNQLSKGRKPGTVPFKVQYRRAIEHLAKLNNTTVTELEVEMYANAIKRARAGDFAFYRDTMDRVHGKAVQPTDITTGGNPFFTVSKEIAEKNGIDLTNPDALPPPQDDTDTETE